MELISISTRKLGNFTDDEFFDFCLDNPNLKIERSAEGEIIVVANTGGNTGILNFKIATEVGIWNKSKNLGQAFDSSTAFRLPNSAIRSPYIAWIDSKSWDLIPSEDKKKFPPICPVFVIEIMSETDNLVSSQNKMSNDWIQNGCQLGWLIDPKTESIYIYRKNSQIELANFDTPLYGEDVLPEFTLLLRELVS